MVGGKVDSQILMAPGVRNRKFYLAPGMRNGKIYLASNYSFEKFYLAVKGLTPDDEPRDTTRHIQKDWDTPVERKIYRNLPISCDTPVDKTRLKAVAVTHAGDWLNAASITAVGLRLSDEAVRVAVGTCQPHTCSSRCQRTSRLFLQDNSPRHIRHSQWNDLIWRAVKKAQFLQLRNR